MRKLFGILMGLTLCVMISCISFAEEIDYSSSEIVQKVQQSLNDAGFDCGTPDGDAGEKTKNAIVQYREANGLRSGDVIDEELLVSLGLMSLTLDEETAMKAAVVAFTNRFAMDIFTEDGNYYDVEKFHSFDDNYLEVIDPGVWKEREDGVWHGDHLKMKNRDYESEFDVSVDVKTDKVNYVVYNISGTAPSYPDAGDLEKDSDYKMFFVVPSSLLKKSVNNTEQSSEDGSTIDAENNNAVTGTVSPELKEFLDSYEQFMNEYCEFIESYDSSDLNALMKYTELMGKYADFSAKAESYDSSKMSTADEQYYIDAMARVEKRLIEASAAMG